MPAPRCQPLRILPSRNHLCDLVSSCRESSPPAFCRCKGASLLLRFERRAGGVPCAVAHPLAGRADRPQERKIRRPDLYVKEFYGSGFPSLSWLDQTPESALKGVREIVESVIVVG